MARYGLPDITPVSEGEMMRKCIPAMAFATIFTVFTAFAVALIAGFSPRTARAAAAADPSTGRLAHHRLAHRINRLEHRISGMIAAIGSITGDTFGTPVADTPRRPSAMRLRVAQSVAGLTVRMDRMEAQMRILTGQMEELTYQLEALRAQNRRMLEDNEMRFLELEENRGGRKKKSQAPQRNGDEEHAAAPPPPPNGGNSADSVDSADNASGSAMAGDNVPVLEPFDMAELIQRNGEGAARLGNAQPGSQNIPPRQAYNRAYDLVTQGRLDEARRSLRDFLARYPDHRLASNAYYWLGETYYANGDYDRAADVFARGYDLHQRSDKAPDLLLKYGMALANTGKRDQACDTFAALNAHFPNVSPVMKDHMRVQRANARCL